MRTRRGQALTRRVCVTVERRSSLLWGRPSLWSRDRLRLLVTRVKVRRLECEARGVALDGPPLWLLERSSGAGLRGADGRPGLGAAAQDASDWRLVHRDLERWYAPVPEPREEDEVL